MKLVKKRVVSALSEVMDPELNVSIIDLGLVYDVIIKPGKVKIIMTLTTIGCPLFSIIEDEIKNKVQSLGVKEKHIEIKLVFDPPWSMEKMSKKARAILGI